jgi:hypothetical protein
MMRLRNRRLPQLILTVEVLKVPLSLLYTSAGVSASVSKPSAGPPLEPLLSRSPSLPPPEHTSPSERRRGQWPPPAVRQSSGVYVANDSQAVRHTRRPPSAAVGSGLPPPCGSRRACTWPTTVKRCDTHARLRGTTAPPMRRGGHTDARGCGGG